MIRVFLFCFFCVTSFIIDDAFAVFAKAADGSPLKEMGAIVTGERSLEDIIISIGRAIDRFWNYKITTLDKHAIATSNIIIGLILFIFGLWVARYLSRFIAKKLSTMLNVEESVSVALEKFSYYLLLVLITLIVLDISNVPLKVFTFVGGALAIGIGFGSQNIINNFISGLILMVERPIKVGDLVEANNTLGRVISIGARCTHLRTGNSVDILLPNSSMLENKVVNWTLTDNVVRVSISVNVVYNTPTHKVESILLKAAKGITDILTTPPPQVYFTNFGDNGLQFEVHFWIELSSPIEKVRIISNLNHAIDALFKENDIAFAYPQRELRLTAHEPLAIKINH